MSAYNLTQGNLPDTVISVGYDNRLSELFLSIYANGAITYTSLQETCVKDSLWLAARLADHRVVLPRELYAELGYANLGLQGVFGAQNNTGVFDVPVLSDLDQQLSAMGALQFLPPEIGAPEALKVSWILAPRDERVAAELSMRLITTPAVVVLIDATLMPEESADEVEMTESELIAWLRSRESAWKELQAKYAAHSAALGEVAV